MTISIAWIRKLPDGEELIFASDSRLSGGYQWDTAQKIFPLAGINAVISFAGDCDLAIPLVHQIKSSCENYGQFRDGSVDIHEVKGHILRIINDMRKNFAHAAPGVLEEMDKKTKILLGGFSFQKKRLVFWRLSHNRSIGEFAAENPTKWHKAYDSRKLFVFCGDHYDEFHKNLALKSWGDDSIEYFDKEPLEVLIDMLQSEEYNAIGGSPQMVKVYEHRNFLPFAFKWNTSKGMKVHLFGRPFMEYEKTTYPIMDSKMGILYPLQHLPTGLEKV
ncbi:hypothetical protein GCM10011332_21250 [Terasakiella brassicae]|uniref:Uncharacterized protein n=1 Tax=Terasakiella brassicae TaxID=1634917 RepID=A0A917C3W3_9PROT|nr:hypothetical protein [Terasakiella brassicae]GGF66889.1 hypothetical protein GCM10011332_21250 [Terasakiella brassicae]